MTRRVLLCLFAIGFLLSVPALAAPRDAQAVLNRCGKPLKGDEIILESTVSGGRRLLEYERGTLTFEKVANIGWTFAYGSRKKQDHLTAEQMEKYMPCLKDALEDSANPAPLVIFTPVQRVEVSLKRSMRQLIIYTSIFILIMGALAYWFYHRGKERERLAAIEAEEAERSLY